MPKVSQEHLERRRQQILDAATGCFARQGFHATSMQDIFKASGLSAGAVYRYFPSKGSLIKAIGSQALPAVLAPLDRAITEATAPGGQAPSAADIVTLIVTQLGQEPLASTRPVIVEVWAEAIRDPEMAAIARDLLDLLAARIETLLAPRMSTARADPAALARLILATIQGYIVQFGTYGDVSPELVGQAARVAFAAL